MQNTYLLGYVTDNPAIDISTSKLDSGSHVPRPTASQKTHTYHKECNKCGANVSCKYITQPRFGLHTCTKPKRFFDVTLTCYFQACEILTVCNPLPITQPSTHQCQSRVVVVVSNDQPRHRKRTHAIKECSRWKRKCELQLQVSKSRVALHMH